MLTDQQLYGQSEQIKTASGKTGIIVRINQGDRQGVHAAIRYNDGSTGEEWVFASHQEAVNNSSA